MEEVKEEVKKTMPSKEMPNVVTGMSLELAEKEVEKWLKFKRVPNRIREENKDSIKHMTEAFADGDLALNPSTHELTLKLQWPVDSLSELVFAPRKPTFEFNNRISSV